MPEPGPSAASREPIAGRKACARMVEKPLIAYVAGPNATIHFSPALVTSNKARAKQGLPAIEDENGTPVKFDMLRPQRLAAPATVYIEQFSAHPMERDSSHLYAAPDGYVDNDGNFSRERRKADDRPVYEATLCPDDGLYMLPYMALHRDGGAWENDAGPGPPPAGGQRQPFYPDGSRVLEEIDRLEVTDDGLGNALFRQASFHFYRVAPSAGYSQVQPENLGEKGGSEGSGERLGADFFPYRPANVACHPPRSTLASITNAIQRMASSGQYAGILWTQGSPRIEETLYWLNLLIDTHLPIVGCAAQRGHRQLGDDGAKNILDASTFIASRIWADGQGFNRTGAVLIQEQQIFAARDVQKGDARPGGYLATGGHGGVIGGVGFGSPPRLTYLPLARHTYNSDVNLARLPERVIGAAAEACRVEVAIKDQSGLLLPGAIPRVSIIKDGNFVGEDDDYLGASDELIEWLTQHKLGHNPLSGFVVEGLAPYGTAATGARQRALERAVYQGLPVVCVGRGNNEGFTAPVNLCLGGRNLTATKARLLLMACLMRFGSLPPALNPSLPTDGEVSAMRATLALYQNVFDTH